MESPEDMMDSSEETEEHRRPISVHLSAIDVESLMKAANTSVELCDDGEAFAEEAFACLSESEIEHIESECKEGSVEELFQSVFRMWDEGDLNELPLILMDVLAEAKVVMTFEEAGDYFEEDDWDEEYDRELGEEEPL